MYFYTNTLWTIILSCSKNQSCQQQSNATQNFFVIIILINIILYNKNKRFQQNKDKIITYANIKINDLFIFKKYK